MIVAGVMSGTSADGINVAICRITGRGFRTRFELLHRSESRYPAAVRKHILGAMNAEAAKVADLARLNFMLGELYADAVRQSLKQDRHKLDLIGCHGQTLYHQGEPRVFLGRRIACTWQTGEGAVLAGRCGVPVISDFRPADMAAGGQGAPLVPFLDYVLFHDQRRGRIVQNIGGIANFTAIPAAASPQDVIACDTGPGNMVIDAVVERLFAKPFDRDGRIAARGIVLDDVVERILKDAFFRRKPPKTAGREEFGREFVAQFLQRCGRAGKEDVVATATALTARSIAHAVRAFLEDGRRKRVGNRGFEDMIVSGGGANNRTLLKMLQTELPGMRVQTTRDYGLPAEAKEAVAFAVMAYHTWQRLPSNIPAATGAKHNAVLGKISYP